MHSNPNKEIYGLELQFKNLVDILSVSFKHHADVAKANGGYIQTGAIENMREIVARMEYAARRQQVRSVK